MNTQILRQIPSKTVTVYECLYSDACVTTYVMSKTVLWGTACTCTCNDWIKISNFLKWQSKTIILQKQLVT